MFVFEDLRKLVCVLQYVRTTVQDMDNVTRPPSAVCVLVSGWKTSSWQTSASSEATVVTLSPFFITTGTVKCCLKGEEHLNARQMLDISLWYLQFFGF